MRKHGGTPSRRHKHVTLAAISPPGVARGRFVGGQQSGLAGSKPPPLFTREASSCSSQGRRQGEPWGASPRPSAPTYLPVGLETVAGGGALGTKASLLLHSQDVVVRRMGVSKSISENIGIVLARGHRHVGCGIAAFPYSRIRRQCRRRGNNSSVMHQSKFDGTSSPLPRSQFLIWASPY